MEDESEYKKLPTEDKCVHKLWKARVAGYEEAIKLFNQIDDEKSPEWNKYLGLIKKFVTDSNAVAQEKGLEAALVFAENCFHAGKTTGEVMSGIVAKCIAAPRTKTKDLALQVTLMYIEMEKHEVVQEELMKGMDHKNPKIVSACVATLNTALKQFGNKVLSLKPLVKKIPTMLTDRDKGVRDEGKALVVEMHRWIGSAIEPHIASLQAVVQQELRDAFAANSGSAAPTRYLRSQQSKMAEIASTRDDDVDGGAEEEDGAAGAGDSPDLDPYELMDPVEILSKLPKDFYEKIEAKKWQERKEVLDALDNLLKNAPKLEAGDYADLVRALKKVITKDSNVMLVALAGRELGALAAGLRNKFHPYAVACISAILEKFKEKKTNVVAALREASDAIYPCTNLEAILEDTLEAFNNKNPSVKAETALFLARGFCKTQPAAFNKKMLKAYVGGLLKLLESAEPTVRDAAAEALGTATKLVGEKNIAPHIGKLENLKEQKIKEFADKAVIQVKIAGPKKEARPKTAPSAKGDTKPGSAQPKPVKRPAAGAAAKKAPAGAAKKGAAAKLPAREQELSPEEVDQCAEELFTPELIAGLQDSNWKTRLNSVRSFHQSVCGLGPSDVGAQVLLRTINKKPGLKDTNIQVLRARIDNVKYVAENFPLSTTSVEFVLPDIVTKLGETTCMLAAHDCLSTLAETSDLGHTVTESLNFAMDLQKNPKVQCELFNWLATAIQEFGMNMDIKPLISHSKKAIAATNPNVRTSAINFLGVLSMYVGPSLISHFDSEKPALKQLISAEMDKYANNTKLAPVRGLNKSASKGSISEEPMEPAANEAEEEEPPPAAAPADSTARTDMSLLVTEPLLAEINDKNWKVRSEALEKLAGIISSSAPIKPSLGELPQALAARLLDSNSKLAQLALQICESLAVAMGVKCKVHVRTFFPGFFQAFGDSKQWIRSAAVSCVDTWCAQAGGPQVALEGEMLLDAMKAGSPLLRAELYQWLADNLPNVQSKSFSRDELSLCVPILFACIEDRAAEVRKKANDCVLPFMLHLGYDAMHKQLEKLKPGSKSVVLAALDKARPNLPVQPLPSKSKKDDPKTVKSGGAQKKEVEKKGADKKPTVAPAGKAKGIVKPSSAGSRGKKEDEDSMPLLPNNNAKNQRIVDDQKLKVLKWNFVTPREEFFELLKDQMTGTGFNKGLVTNMFHNDFRYHLKALETLSEDLVDNGPALMANLDLILKWLTLRFFDTNPSVIMKGLEYLSSVFNYLMESDYTMAEYEANCFIPYLVLKVGDPKDLVRNGVKALFKQICVVYSVTKLFGYLMEGLKSKNARQRTECLECIGHLIETYGTGVMTPSAGAALKELARHIGDRDNGVRTAALNCIAQAYFLDGEKVYKMIGQVSDKELSLLEERIKRASKTRNAENRKSVILPLSASGKPLARQPSESDIAEECSPVPSNQISVEMMTPNNNDEEEQPEQLGPFTVTMPPPAPAVVQGPFGLDPDVLAQLEAQKPRVDKLELPPMPDISFLDDPIVIPNFRPVFASTRLTTNIHPLSPTQRLTAPPPSLSQQPSVPIDDTKILDAIHNIASPNLKVAMHNMKAFNATLSSGYGPAFRRYEDRLVAAAAQQVKQLRTGAHAPDDAAVAYKILTGMLVGFYEVGTCGRAVSSAGVGTLLAELLRVLGAAERPGGVATLLEGREADRLVRALNCVCVRVLDNSDHTALLCSLVSLLHETINVSYPEYPRYQELLMKCFWKTLKNFDKWDVDDIDIDAVLKKIHLFYKAYPNKFWREQAEISDTPYRTVKTLVHTLVKKKGVSIMNHLTQIPDAEHTDLYVYLLKVFQQLKLEYKPGETTTTPAPHNVTSAIGVGHQAHHGNSRLPRDVHEQLVHVLKCIGNKEQNQEALIKLYDIRERHPDVDIWSYMQGSSFYFRSYVERGLSDVAERRRLANLPTAGLAATLAADIDDNNAENEDDDDENLHLVFMERLRKLQAKAGLPLSTPSFLPRTPAGDKNLADTINENTIPRSHNIDPQFELHSTQPLSQRNECDVDVEALRLKLQQIKNSSKR